MQKLSLTKRPAKIGKNVNTRTEMHGEEEIPAQDIPLSGIVLNNLELADVCDEETAGTGFFKMDGDQYVPRIAASDPTTLSHKFTGASVKISGGGLPATTYHNAKIKGIVLEAQTGGMVLMSCTLQVNPEDGDPSGQQLINKKISITIKAELETVKDDEPELPLDHQDSAGDGVPLDGLTGSPDIDETMSRTGRRIQASAKKQGRKSGKQD
jgi:hypothetical protein